MIIETGYPYNGLGRVISYENDALDCPVAVHLPDGISTYKTYNARNQVTGLTNQCDDCGWILGRYVYTYDDRGYIVAEHTEEAREMDPYGRQPYTPYKPDRTGKNCDHGRNRNLSYYLLVLDKTYTCVKYRSSWPVYYAGLNFFSHYDAGKLLYAVTGR